MYLVAVSIPWSLRSTQESVRYGTYLTIIYNLTVSYFFIVYIYQCFRSESVKNSYFLRTFPIR